MYISYTGEKKINISVIFFKGQLKKPAILISSAFRKDVSEAEMEKRGII